VVAITDMLESVAHAVDLAGTLGAHRGIPRWHVMMVVSAA
jgi:hypothetical protein